MAAFPPGKRPGTHFTRGWVGPRVCADTYRKFRPYRHSIPCPSSPQRVAVSFTLKIYCMNTALYICVYYQCVALAPPPPPPKKKRHGEGKKNRGGGGGLRGCVVFDDVLMVHHVSLNHRACDAQSLRHVSVYTYKHNTQTSAQG